MAEYKGLPFSPILVVKLRTIFDGDCRHMSLSLRYTRSVEPDQTPAYTRPVKTAGVIRNCPHFAS